MHLAYCSDIEAFNKDRLRDQQWSYRFPGSGWLTCLYRVAAESGIEVASGDVALANVASNKWSAKDVFVIQEMESTIATKLLNMGATPFLITCLEAPLYAPFFYDRLSRIAHDFKFSLGFGFSEGQFGFVAPGKNLPFRFPSFYLEDMRAIRPWEGRQKVVLVAANKYKTKRIFLPGRFSLMEALRQMKSVSWQFISPAYRKSLAASLHDQRLEAIEYFARKRELDLYGVGWGDLHGLSANWVSKLKNLINDQYQGVCQNKLETISGYRFSICFENMILPGYVTEKIVDCFVAGTVPIYSGAPDIQTLIPAEAFIDMRNFNSLEQLDSYMHFITKQDAIRMMEVGRAYLQTDMGKLHSYEGFAENIIRFAKTC